jgi:DNA-binding transcriptional LysR family regulator
MMEIRQLRYFLAVAEELHFSRAAARLHIAQPPLSQQIRRLEEDLEAKLFHRTNRSVRLTAAGEVLLREVQPLLANLDKAKMLARRASRGQTGRLSIAFIHSATYSVLPLAVRAFRETYPDVELSLQEMHITHQLEALSREEIQIGVLRPPVNDAAIVTETLQTEPLLVALPAGHALASKKTLSLKDLAHIPFVMARHNRAGFFEWIKGLCREAGFEPRVSQEATDMHTMVSLVSVGLGVALVPDMIKHTPVTNVVYRRLEENPTTQLAMAWRGDRTSPALKAFVQLTRETNAKRLPKTGRNAPVIRDRRKPRAARPT